MHDRDGACLPSNHIVTIDGRKGRGSRIDSNQSMKCTSKNQKEKWGQGRREGGEREREAGRQRERPAEAGRDGERDKDTST